MVFQAQDATGKIGVSNVPVTFSGTATGTTQCPNPAAPCLTDSNGEVTIGVHSAQVAAAPYVVASITLPNGETASAVGQAVVVGTQPSAGRSSISCSPINLAAYAGPAGAGPTCFLQGALETSCTISLVDRFGNAIGIAVPGTVYYEEGPPIFFPYDTPAFGQASPGVVSIDLFSSDCFPLDVAPLPPGPGLPDGEPSYPGSCNGEQRTFNPRDGLVTVIGVFTGEEPFEDTAGTGTWVPGDAWVDMPQPFVDANDNSVWDPDEYCVGNNGNGSCAGPNHVWDGNAPVWVETRILLTGDPLVSGSPALGDDAGASLATWAPAQFTLSPGVPFLGSVLWPDGNLNVPAGAPGMVTDFGFDVPSSGCTSPPSVSNLSMAGPGDSLGMTFARLGLPGSGNPACDAGYYLDDAGQAQANPYCTYLTSLTNFSGGFLSIYELSEATSCDGGAVTIQATAQSSLDTNLAETQITGTAE
jgi:hypothetical protein